MKKKVPGHGRSRDEEPAGRAGPRRIFQFRSQFRFQFLYPPSEVRIWRFGQIITSLERFGGAVCCFSIDFLNVKEMSERGDLHENVDFLEIKRVLR